MEDQRLEPRTHLIYYLRVFYPDSGKLFGHVVDISRSGMLITSDKPMETNARYHLCVENVDSLDDVDTVAVDLECRWCESDPENVLYDAGFKLINADTQANAIFTAFQ